MPDDGYQWSKYGQRHIKNINKIRHASPTALNCFCRLLLHYLMCRSYFKCRNKECKAKKRAEWPPADPSNLRILYDGSHHHHPPVDSQQLPGVAGNRYELGNQVFGRLNDHHNP
ncbi:hypothetical protein BHM03_00000720 [Ensete ventricosum]|uniref:WRKY domain-containing protein n=1 Tax=Ensete ventricosum TaxID=4639 RepID=A0A427B8I1_ENSVE|nr:hypothetical protein B296_00012948 [Ensete ventricosum]RZR76098.1 hypothetical protein BHM03_00000720 [Ensete ventricosum]